jgi:hypothetical protein
MIITTRYQYDHIKNKCEEFKYHGCGGNWNNFPNETSCIARCSKIFYFSFDKNLNYFINI